MTTRRAIVMFGASPIPAGHRVEVFVLAKDTGVFSRDVQPVEREPLVHDLTAGIWYGRTWHFACDAPGLLEARAPQPAADVQVAERFGATVATCVVASYGQSSEQCVATTLYLDVD